MREGIQRCEDGREKREEIWMGVEGRGKKRGEGILRIGGVETRRRRRIDWLID